MGNNGYAVIEQCEELIKSYRRVITPWGADRENVQGIAADRPRPTRQAGTIQFRRILIAFYIDRDYS